MRYLLFILLLSLLLPSHIYAQSLGQDQCELTPREKSADLFIKWAPIVLAAWCAIIASNNKNGGTNKPLMQRLEDLENKLNAVDKRVDKLEGKQNSSNANSTTSSPQTNIPHRLVPKSRQVTENTQPISTQSTGDLQALAEQQRVGMAGEVPPSQQQQS
jgi:hypothetical protein